MWYMNYVWSLVSSRFVRKLLQQSPSCTSYNYHSWKSLYWMLIGNALSPFHISKNSRLFNLHVHQMYKSTHGRTLTCISTTIVASSFFSSLTFSWLFLGEKKPHTNSIASLNRNGHTAHPPGDTLSRWTFHRTKSYIALNERSEWANEQVENG